MKIKRNDLKIRDPFILKDNNMFYMYGTCNYLHPDSHGFDAFVSDDLELFDGPHTVFLKNDEFWGKKQFWAPEVYKIDDKYYMIASFKNEEECRGCHVLVSDSPLGEFKPLTSERITPKNWECLDGTLFKHNNKTYLFFCHEWLQVHDGEVCVEEVSDDLKKILSEPIILFKGSDAKWTKRGENYITDGPYLYELENKKVIMIWSSGGEKGYTTGYAINDGNDLTKNWKQIDEPIFEDGGHGMFFEDSKGKLCLILHSPNKGECRAKIFYVEIKEDRINLVEKNDNR